MNWNLILVNWDGIFSSLNHVGALYIVLTGFLLMHLTQSLFLLFTFFMTIVR